MRKVYNLNHKFTEIIFDEFPEFSNRKDYLFIVDNNVLKYYRSFFLDISINDIYIFDANEQNKQFEEVQKIIDWVKIRRCNRHKTIWGIGGGITLDISGFVASIFMRGCKLNFIPTTFLAMVDASIGGKTAINSGDIKNMIGTFYPAEKIYIIPEFLNTLPIKELDQGWVETIKISLIVKTGFYKEIMLSQKKISQNILEKAINEKMKICESDPEDRNKRNLLNLGHTFAHIIESISHFQISHGYSVAIGIKAAALLSYRCRWITLETYKNIIYPLVEFKLLKEKSIKKYMANYEDGLLFNDKKTTNQINLILLNDFQSPFKISFSKIHLIKEVLEEIANFGI